MAQREPTERTNKFLEITDPKKAVGLWCYHAVRETAITPIGNTFKALGRFLPEDTARWKRRYEMAAAMEASKGKGCGCQVERSGHKWNASGLLQAERRLQNQQTHSRGQL